MAFSTDFMNAIRPFSGIGHRRLGPHNDGGYVVPEVVLEKSRMLVSLGFGHDFRFEREFLKLDPENTVLLYDSEIDLTATIKKLFEAIKLYLSSVSRLVQIKSFNQRSFQKSNNNRNSKDEVRRSFRKLKIWVFATIRFLQLMATPRIRYRKKKIVGLANRENEKSLSSILPKIQEEFIVKMDIEGSEYDVISECVHLLERSDCLLIEFHKVGQDLNAFIRALNALKESFMITHLHLNNYSGIYNGIPDVLEITFLHKKFIDLDSLTPAVEIPGPLDGPNNPSLPEYNYKWISQGR